MVCLDTHQLNQRCRHRPRQLDWQNTHRTTRFHRQLKGTGHVVGDTIAVVVFLRIRASVRVHRFTRRGVRAIVEQIVHAVVVLIRRLPKGTSVLVDRRTRWCVGAEVDIVRNTVTVIVFNGGCPVIGGEEFDAIIKGSYDVDFIVDELQVVVSLKGNISNKARQFHVDHGTACNANPTVGCGTVAMGIVQGIAQEFLVVQG